jgi:ABC-type antimicrobial peptide transport system permease subunit
LGARKEALVREVWIEGALLGLGGALVGLAVATGTIEAGVHTFGGDKGGLTGRRLSGRTESRVTARRSGEILKDRKIFRRVHAWSQSLMHTDSSWSKTIRSMPPESE